MNTTKWYIRGAAVITNPRYNMLGFHSTQEDSLTEMTCCSGPRRGYQQQYELLYALDTRALSTIASSYPTNRTTAGAVGNPVGLSVLRFLVNN